MKEGWKIFREKFLNFADIDCMCYPTISSLGDAYMIEQGCYENVHEIAGIPQRFIAKCSVGGRVMVANNKRTSVTDDIDKTTRTNWNALRK